MKSIRKIIVVEDEALTAMNLKLQLARFGYNVSNIVPTGEEAIASIEQENPDLILMDIRLAGMLNGIETARQIQTTHKDLPIIFMTGYTDPELQKQAEQLHPLAYVIKPVNIQELKTIISDACIFRSAK
ncbi:response regulator receiver protein [Candidatus Vecturithrix granuli]|uniref:Response regulator receiver protein n=1 Tax=Vecturithrix granuli TaxID=1499967 RepID=A0A081C273_VECG1|nr:response regulator receiver protein [Candidatus Vecturithrix granuli]